MGWLRSVGKSFDEYVLRDSHLEPDAAEWAQWAAQHGWTYQAEAPELAGRYRSELKNGAERYLHLLTTELHGLRVIGFEHRRFERNKQSDPTHSWQAYIAVRLPGLPPKEFVKKSPDHAFRRLGGSVPSGVYLGWTGDELVAERPDHLHPTWLQGNAESLALQVASAPPSFWQPRT